MTDFGVYVHFPYCDAKCGYCDFNSYALRDEGQLEVFARALSAEMHHAAEAEGLMSRTVGSLFFGGGTPSLWPAARLVGLLDELKALFAVAEDAEVTLEANPGTVTQSALTALREGGFNRISFGAQSFSPRLLRLLGRIHDGEAIRRGVQMARQAGFGRLNLDVMYGLPGQSEEELSDTLEEAVALAPDHVSAYALELEPRTQFGRLYRQGKLALPDEETVVQQGDAVAARLQEAGFEQYEISNFARPGERCRHNVLYWQRGEYRGFGPGAHSFVGERRFWNLKSPDVYRQRALSGGTAVEGGEDVFALRQAEWMYLRLRLMDPLPFAAFEAAFGRPMEEAFPGVLEALAGDGLIVIGKDALSLTARGRWCLNQVSGAFFDPRPA